MKTEVELKVPPAKLVDVDRLRVDCDNPNRMGAKQLKALKQSIKRFGFIVPIITNRELLVADGEQRLTVARELGMKQVSVIRLPVEDVDRRLLRQVLNKLRGEHELIADAHEFQRIIQQGQEDDLKYLLDLNDSQLERYLAKIHEPHAEDYAIPDIDKVQTNIQKGDIHQLGTHRLMCGDATSLDDIGKLTNQYVPELGIHDPPYGIDLLRGKSGKVGGYSRVYAPVEGDTHQLIAHYLLKLTKKTILFGGNYFADKLPPSSCWIVWDKERSPGLTFAEAELLWSNLKGPVKIVRHKWDGFKRASERGQTRIHPTQKPVQLIAEILMRVSEPKINVLDCFGGSGSTLIACEQTDRSCYMMEIDPRYCQIIINRWESYTNEKAVRPN